jgi:GH25 family lysozyme M1 (1,4-beta-N-acetylmuramidase)
MMVKRLWILVVILLVAACNQGGTPEQMLTQAVNCSGYGQPLGIDVSHYQGQINWQKVRESGMVFASARIAVGPTDQRSTRFDTEFERNWQGIKDNGLVRMAYYFWRYWGDPVEQANHVINAVGQLGPGDLGIQVDLEWGAFTHGGTDSKQDDFPGQTAALAKLQQFTNLVEAGTGKPVIIYTNRHFWNQYFNSDAYSNRMLWQADYSTCSLTPPTGWSGWAFHQYTSTGSVPGVVGDVDVNRFQGTEAQLRALADQAPSVPSVINFQTRTFVDIEGSLVESITAYGRAWNFDANGNPWRPGNGLVLNDVPRYATGPCAAAPYGQCVFDSRTFVNLNGQWVESISAYGKFWNFDLQGNPWGTSNGSSLHSVARYAAGPCAGVPDGQCKFDTRTFVALNGQLVESISAYGKFWNFDANGNPWGTSNGANLQSVARYAAGPCAGIPDGQCTFESRTFVVLNGEMVESISAYGQYWNYRLDGSPYPDAPHFSGPLSSVVRYQAIQP